MVDITLQRDTLLTTGEEDLQKEVSKSGARKNVLPYAKQDFIKKIEELKRVAISVPKIGISYSSTIEFKPFKVKRNIQDFDIAASKIERYDTINDKLLQVLDADALIVENPENMLAVSLLECIPEFSSEDAEFIIDVVDQYLALIDGTMEDKKKIVRRYATVIVDDLREQIYASKEENTEFVFHVQKDLIVFGPFMKSMKRDGRLNFKKPVPEKKNIKHYLFDGFKKSYYSENAFDSDDERRFSVVLEEDDEVVRFIKPPLNQLGLFYRAAKQYNPDFLVETKDKKYMIEVKASNQTETDEVQEKAKAALKWCECASKVDADGKTWEYRLILGDKIVVGNTFKYVIGLAVPVLQVE
jgi:type III restriction enzyme